MYKKTGETLIYTNEIANTEAHLDELSAPKDEDGKSPSKQGEAPPSTASAKIHSITTK